MRNAGGRPYLHGQFALGRILESWQKGGPGARARPKHEIANASRPFRPPLVSIAHLRVIRPRTMRDQLHCRYVNTI